ncbi:EpsG family protein [Sphingomonas sp. IC-11]|uniref:EpsG family protein n=1 Tax=Sphingomonas sp. IC-11 TaxID=2898528 RepID=UPI001E364BDB|nr:EpsG family protein [Sphingomonas sp. IC-11]MCD2316980.1 EpsG family protein [Sphingomonas sp. IC-11]
MVFAAFLVSVFTSLKARNALWTYLMLLASFTAMFCVMNVAKVVEGDWLWYTEHYALFRDMALYDYLNSRIENITIKPNEPVYYAIANATFHLSSGSIPALASVVTITDYGAIGAAIWLIGRSTFASSKQPVNPHILIACCLIAVTFTLVTQLVRQEMAACFSLLGFAFMLRRRYLIGGLVAIIAVATHQSAILGVFILYAPVLALHQRRSTAFARIPLALAFGLVALGLGYVVSRSSIADLGSKDDGAVSTALILFDVALGLALGAATILTRDRSGLGKYVLLSFALFYLAFLPMMTVPLAALRLYFYMDLLRGLAVLLLFSSLVPARTPNIIRVLIGSAVSVGAVAYLHLRVERSPFTFRAPVTSYIFYPAEL